jgi:hypothetical protein
MVNTAQYCTFFVQCTCCSYILCHTFVCVLHLAWLIWDTYYYLFILLMASPDFAESMKGVLEHRLLVFSAAFPQLWKYWIPSPNSVERGNVEFLLFTLLREDVMNSFPLLCQMRMCWFPSPNSVSTRDLLNSFSSLCWERKYWIPSQNNFTNEYMLN